MQLLSSANALSYNTLFQSPVFSVWNSVLYESEFTDVKECIDAQALLLKPIIPEKLSMQDRFCPA